MNPSGFSWTADHLHWLGRSVLCWLATVDADGQPNVAPKEVFVPWGDDQLLIAHIASPVSARNIQHHPKVCASFVDVFAQKGFKLQGLATVMNPSEPGFDSLAAPLARITGDRFPLRGLIRVHVQASAPIRAPSYTFFPDTTEAAQIRAAWLSYTRRLPDQAQDSLSLHPSPKNQEEQP